MSKFMKAIETLKRWIGLDKRSGEDRRKKKPRKRKHEKNHLFTVQCSAVHDIESQPRTA